MMKKLIIIGGGFAGSLIAKKLEKHFKVTFIDTKDYFEFTPSILKTILEPSYIKKIQSLHINYLKKSKFIRGTVTELKSNSVCINKKEIAFDYGIIASGSFYHAPIKEHGIISAQRAENLKKNYDKLHKAKEVLIIGGGIVGVELAAEIATYYNNKKITLIHSRKRLMDRFSQKVSSYIHKFLKKHNVELILNDRVILCKKRIYKTKNNKQFKPNIAFAATGISPNSDFMKKNFSRHLDKKGFFKLKSTLQLNKFNNIFAVGDINDCNVEKTAQNAEKQARLAIKNISNLEKNKPLNQYKNKITPVVVSLGKYNGLFIYKGFVFRGIIPAIIKYLIEKKEMLKRQSFPIFSKTLAYFHIPKRR